MKKRILSVVMLLCMALTLFPAFPARAASSTAGDSLSGLNRKIYDLVKAEIIKVAAGERESSVFTFSLSDLGLADVTWSSEDLGVALMRDSASGKFTDASWNAAREQLYKKIGYSPSVISGFWQIFRRDCVMESFWFGGASNGDVYKDTAGNEVPVFKWTFKCPEDPDNFGPTLTASNDGTSIHFHPDNILTVQFLVEEKYSKHNDNNTHKAHQVDTNMVRGITEIVTGQAMKIVYDNASKSDFEKLKAYKDAICSLVSYDYDAAKNGVKASGIEHWNMLYVFDGDPSTNVVCEGYAKAFQYLCDLSKFSGHVKSYLISGNVTGGNLNPGGHMWNHVEVNGRMWLVDITHCDGDSPTDDLFMKAPVSQNASQSLRYSFRYGGSSIGYLDIENYYGDADALGLDILTLDNREYDPAYYFASILRNNVDSYVSYKSWTAGSSVTITCGSHDGKNFKGWSGLDGLTITAGTASSEKITFVMPERAVEITAMFEDIPTYTLTSYHNISGKAQEYQFRAGVTITSTAGWSEGYVFKEWTGLDGEDIDIKEGSAATRVVKWVMPRRNVTMKSVYWRNPFTDVSESNYFCVPVMWAVEESVTKGTTETTFSPGNTCTTANIITFLWRANNSPEPSKANPFSDVPAGAYYEKAAVWACEKGMVSGGTFNGNSPCTRAATMKYLWILAGSPQIGSLPFDDVDPSADYAWAVAWAVESGITKGTTDTTFSPDNTCTRGQIVTFLHRHYAQ